ncbi:transketolase family protein [candidate division WWE3 bacterium]|uniref:Transketolase family protein n=1 Tax=candidate division WWE3 bacterium TaxID=2053526 RepID=A0A955RQE2_UNCKA|nr:transketolase family protein [candidate division WWE3 bacterium]
MNEKINFPAEDLASNRDGFGDALVEAGRLNKNIVVATADLSESTRVEKFAKEFPDRFLDVGVAEQNLVAVASGLAAAGKIAFATSYAAFSPGRNWEQMRTTISYNDQPVKIIGSHGGLSVGPDGATHQALEDIALMRVLPNMTVLAPGDYEEARKATMAAIGHPGPIYLRLSRDKTPKFTTTETPFEIGEALLLREGSDVTIVSTGTITYEALLAAQALAMEETSVEVLHMPTVKPLDTTSLLNSVRKTGCVVTVEDHQIAGGLGGAVAEFLSESHPVLIRRVGVQDRFGQSGRVNELYAEYEMDSYAIIKNVKEILARRGKN